jgi:antitoxin HigA-1
MEAQPMSKSPTITDIGEPDDWLPNIHAGEILASEFMEPVGLTTAALAKKVDLPEARLQAIVDGSTPVDAEADLRLGRYFSMSEGFFLRLQNAYDLLETKRALWSAIMQVEPRVEHAA